MSKQSEAKVAQGYMPKAPTCVNCKNVIFDLVTPDWMKNMEPPSEDPEYFKVKKNQRCGIGSFSVKSTAVCKLYESKL